jgi:hypothetical protein
MVVVRRCEAAWWSGVLGFYGLPNGVSTVTLASLFPRFSLVHRVLLSKISLALCALRRLDTLFPKAPFYDRGFLFDRHRTGFLQTVKDWGQQLELPDLFLVGDRSEASGMLTATREQALDSAWDNFSRISSTRFPASVLSGRGNFYEVSLAASRVSRLGLHVFLLAITASLSQSYLRSRLWDKFAFVILGRFQVFIHLHRGGHCERDEVDLFETLNELCLV